MGRVREACDGERLQRFGPDLIDNGWEIEEPHRNFALDYLVDPLGRYEEGHVLDVGRRHGREQKAGQVMRGPDPTRRIG